MFPRFILVLVVVALLWVFLYWFRNTPSAQVAATLKRAAVWLALAVIVILALSGRLNWLMGVLASLLLFARRLLPLLRHAPLLARLLGRHRGGRASSTAGAENGPAPRMSREEAYAILGLTADASPDEIIAAHRRLMQKLHPDRDGSTYLAAQINRAKEVLLEKG